ncbi:MAG: sensor histidine kinase, partial [Leadbetterella sp.]
YMIIVQVALVVYAGIRIMLKGYAPARYYMISWAVLFVALILFSLKMMGVLSLTTLNYTLLPIGAAIEVLMLSLGLGNRINTTQKEKTLAQEELVKQLLENEEVKNRIARDLHDDLGSTLSSIRILSEFAKNKAIIDPEQTQNLLQKIAVSSQKLQDNLQDIVWTNQTKDNLVSDLSIHMIRFGGEVLEAKNITVDFDIKEDIYNIKLGSSMQYDVFMVFKEAINNIAKYAEAKNAIIRMYKQESNLVLEIKDDGQGFDVKQERVGNGLKNMTKRAQDLKGEFTIVSSKELGTHIKLIFPVTQ